MVAKPLVIAFLCVGAFGAGDMLLKTTSSADVAPTVQYTQADAGLDGEPASTAKAEPLGGYGLENPLEKSGVQAFDIVSTRVLFDPSRRQPALVVETPPAPGVAVTEVAPAIPTPDPNDFTLLGIAVAEQSGVALLRWNKTQETLRLRPGDTYTGWTIAEVSARNVRVEQQGQSFNLTLFKGAGDQAATAVQD